MRKLIWTLGIAGATWMASASMAQAPTTPSEAPTSNPQAASLPTAENPCPAVVTSPLCTTLGDFLNNPSRDAALFDFSYGAPESPVLSLVGVQADQITRAESLRRFGLSLLTGLGDEETGPGIAIDLSPYWLLTQGAVSLQDYRDFTPLQRVFARTKLGAAASRGNEAEAIPSSIVLSLSSQLLDAPDTLWDRTFESCVAGDNSAANPRGRLWPLVDQALEGMDLPLNPREANAYFDREIRPRMAAIRPQLEAAYQACADETAREMSRRPSLNVGAGLRIIGDAGHLRGFENSGMIVWGTLATGVFGGGRQANDPFWGSLRMQVRGVLHGRYTFSEDIFDEEGSLTGEADSALLVAGLESVPVADSPDNFRWSLQAGWNMQDAPNALTEDRNYWRFLGLARLRVSEGIWLNATVGRVQGRGVEDDTYVSIGFSIAPAAGSDGIDNFYRRIRN